MFASRTKENPDSKNDDKVSWSGREPITFDKEEGAELNGSYFLSVCGYDTSYYTILTTVDRKNETDNNATIIAPSTLDLNIPQHVFIDNMDIQYFTFNVAMEDDDKKDINIVLTPLKG